MASTDDYRLIVHSNGRELLVTVEGAMNSAAGRQLREVTAAAAKLGIAVRVRAADRHPSPFVTGESHPRL